MERDRDVGTREQGDRRLERRGLVYFLLFTFHFALLTLLITWTAVVHAQEPVSDNEVNEVAKDLYCPVCENVPLDVCPTQACADWRELIRQQLGEGQSKSEIIEYFALNYGDRVRSRPSGQGFSLAVWILPVVAVIGGALFFSRYLSRLKQTSATERPVETAVKRVPPASESSYLEEVEKALQDRES